MSSWVLYSFPLNYHTHIKTQPKTINDCTFHLYVHEKSKTQHRKHTYHQNTHMYTHIAVCSRIKTIKFPCGWNMPLYFPFVAFRLGVESWSSIYRALTIVMKIEKWIYWGIFISQKQTVIYDRITQFISVVYASS